MIQTLINFSEIITKFQNSRPEVPLIIKYINNFNVTLVLNFCLI